jgi:hypothetical protein
MPCTGPANLHPTLLGGYWTQMDTERLLDQAERLSKALTPGDLDHTLDRITRAAVEILPETDYASMTVLHEDGRLDTVAPTDDLLLSVDAAQHELKEGPCYQAAAESVHVVSPELASDPRFPRYAAAAISAGIGAQAGISLFTAPASRGALNLYARQPGSFRDLGVLGELFRHQAVLAIDYAREIHNLQEAVRTRGLIGSAIGIVMERYQLPEERAFAFLTRLSQQSNVKLRILAEQLVNTTNS